MPKISLRAAARAMNRARKHASGGHQGRKPGAISRTKPRCPCGKMTLKRAQARGHSSDHRIDCSFYPVKDLLRLLQRSESMRQHRIKTPHEAG